MDLDWYTADANLDLFVEVTLSNGDVERMSSFSGPKYELILRHVPSGGWIDADDPGSSTGGSETATWTTVVPKGLYKFGAHHVENSSSETVPYLITVRAEGNDGAVTQQDFEGLLGPGQIQVHEMHVDKPAGGYVSP